MVAAATSNLCEAANASVQGHASEEKLISSAKQVAASTAQLLVACKVKADQDSEAMRRLQVRTHTIPQSESGYTMVTIGVPQWPQPQNGFGFDRLMLSWFLTWAFPLIDCWECSEEGVGQLGAGSSEGSVWQSRWWQCGGQDEVCGWNSTGKKYWAAMNIIKSLHCLNNRLTTS